MGAFYGYHNQEIELLDNIRQMHAPYLLVSTLSNPLRASANIALALSKAVVVAGSIVFLLCNRAMNALK